MRIEAVPFTTTDWGGVPVTEHPGETGVASWRTVEAGNIRVRMVEYSPATSPTTGASAATCCWCSRAS
jgi:hypothetical protein